MANKSMQNIGEFMEQDHHRLDELFGEFLLKKNAEPLSGFISGLKRHIIIEEEILFPVFEEKTGIKQGPTEVMRREHRVIRDLLSKLHDSFTDGHKNLEKIAEEITTNLKSHNHKEENILYPWIDNQFSEAETEKAFLEIRALPPGAEGSCCQP